MEPVALLSHFPCYLSATKCSSLHAICLVPKMKCSSLLIQEPVYIGVYSVLIYIDVHNVLVASGQYPIVWYLLLYTTGIFTVCQYIKSSSGWWLFKLYVPIQSAKMSSPQSPVVFVAGIFRDLVAVSPRFPKPGETILGTDFQMGFGGKGANQCVMASRLGAHTAIVGKVGNDDHGKAYKDSLEGEGVDLTYLGVEEGVSSGIATIFVESSSGENQIIIVPGANERATPEFVGKTEEMIARSKAVICQLEMNMEGSLLALKLARKHGVLTILNAAPGKAGLSQEFLENTDILCVNETEAELLCGLPANNEQEWRSCVKALHEKGCGTVVLTLGASGAMVGVSGQKADLVPAPRVVSVVDTTGAGDAFVGSLVFYLTERPELGMLEAVRRSCCVASISVQRPGTQASYPKHGEVPVELLQ